MNNWKTDKRWSDKFLPEIKQILGLYLIGEPPIEEDQERNTDLMVLKMDAVRIACRIRKYEYVERYSSEFTIRASRPSGTKTELTKIIEGWGDYLFYGFASSDEISLVLWHLISLNAFRLWIMRHMAANAGQLPSLNKLNTDGSSGFMAFNLNAAPAQLIVAKSDLVAAESDW